MWNQNSTKLANLDVKVRVLEVLAQSMGSLGRAGLPLLSVVNGNSIAVGRSAGDFIRELEELDGLMDAIQEKLGKKLGVGTTVIKTKKSGVRPCTARR
jgi:hypothetical protein